MRPSSKVRRIYRADLGAVATAYPARLKYCTARSCRFAAWSVRNVPRFRRLPVLGSFFREYKRYPPDLSLRIMALYLAAGAQCAESLP